MSSIPHSVQLERVALNVALGLDLEAKALVCEALTPETFYVDPHRVWFDYARTHREWDFEVASDEMRAKLSQEKYRAAIEALEFVFDSTETTQADIQLVCNRLQQLAAARENIQSAQEEAAEGYAQGASDPVGYLERAEALREKRARNSLVSSKLSVTHGESLEATVARIRTQTAASLRRLGTTTGIRRLDEMILGLRRKKFHVFAGRPGMGKSVFGHQCALAAGVVGRSLLFSFEMDRDELNVRSLSMATHMDSTVLEAAGDLPPERFKQIEMGLRGLVASDLRIYDDVSTIEQVRAISRQERAMAGDDLALIVVDYIQLIESRERFENRQQHVAYVSRSLKKLARDLNVPVLGLSQLNRDLERREDKRPGMADLRESGALEQDADVIGFLYRDEVYNPQTAVPGEMEVIIGKQRGGRIGTVKTKFHGAHSRIEDV